MDLGASQIDLSDYIAGIYASLQQKGVARLQRAFKRVGGELVPTGATRWQILTDAPLKRCLVCAVGRDRAVEIGKQVSVEDEGMKVHRMIELMEPAEVIAFEELLSELEVEA